MLMEVLAWNIQGLNDPLKQKEVKSSVRRLKVAIICILETRAPEVNERRIMENIVFGWDVLHNYNSHYLGRIWVVRIQVWLIHVLCRNILKPLAVK